MKQLIPTLLLLTACARMPSEIRKPINRMPPPVRDHFSGVAFFLYMDCAGQPDCDSLVNSKIGKMMLAMSPSDYEKLREAYIKKMRHENRL
jgi:hypothetical protein